MNTFPMLALDDPGHLERVTKTFDFAIPAALGRSGYFLGHLNADGEASGRDWFPRPPEIVLTRQNADVLFWMIKQFMLLKAQGQPKPSSPNGNGHQTIGGRLCGHVEKSRPMGEFSERGNRRHCRLQFNQSAPSHGRIGAGGRLVSTTRFLIVAEKSADYHYQRDFVQNLAHHGPSPTLCKMPIRDSAAGFMSSLMTLYETTGNKRWLEM